jgi:hypothetical protein
VERRSAQAKESGGGAQRRRTTELGKEKKWRGCTLGLTGVNGDDGVGSFVTEDGGTLVTTR